MGINKLNSTDKIQGGDQLAIGSTSNGDDRRASVSLLTAYMQTALNIPLQFGEYYSQYAAPSATAFDIVITDGADDNTNVHLILTPTGPFADGTITLPPVPGAIDKQEVLVNTTQDVTALIVALNGATAVTGAPTTLAADDFFRLKLDLPTSTWYRVG